MINTYNKTYILKKDSNKIHSNIKLKLLKKYINNDFKFIANMIENLNNLLNLRTNTILNIEDILNKNNCKLNTLKKLDNNALKNIDHIICFTNTIDNKYMSLYTYCKENKINIIFIHSTKTLKSLLNFNDLKTLPKCNINSFNITSMIKKNGYNNILFDINIDDINIKYNFEDNITQIYLNKLTILNNYSNSKIIRFNEKLPKELYNSKIKYINLKNKFKFKNILKILKKYFNLTNLNTTINISSNNKLTENVYFIKEISNIFKVFFLPNYNNKISLVYDILCKDLDDIIKSCNYCFFINNKCIAQRDTNYNLNWPKNNKNGCCYDISLNETCKFLENKKCSTNCVSCKLFTCKYLKKFGIDFNLHKCLLINTFVFSLKRPELIWNFFKDKKTSLKGILS